MTKERKGNSPSSGRSRSRASPYRCSSSRSRRSSSKNPIEDVREIKEAMKSASKKSLEYIEEELKEWEEARCPVCMEHPHNAVLLQCSSYGKGCRPYMCDTSYRHSNCLDQFRKAFAETASSVTPQEEETSHSSAALHLMASEATQMYMEEEEVEEEEEDRSEDQAQQGPTIPCESQVESKLLCPLCRGEINGWVAMEPARQYMNAKSRGCACETCDFSGTYTELRKHARLEHPLVRPSEADPERERNWRRLERQRDIGDVLSTFRSSIGDERDEDGLFSVDEGRWLTFFLFVRVIRPGTSNSSSWSGASRVRGQPRSRRRTTLWGETYDMDTASATREDENGSPLARSGTGSGRRRERSRPRTTPEREP